MNQAINAVRRLIWIYLFFLLVEGAIRKWFLPGLADVFLIIRDPIVLLAYVIAIKGRFFPQNSIIIGTLALAFFSLLLGLLAEDTHPIVTAYGLRINYLHIPFLFLIPKVFDQTDVIRMGKVFLWASIPMTVLVMAQFFSPPGSFLLRDVHGGEGIMGALGRMRPSGTFSFVTGIAIYYPMVLAFALAFLLQGDRKLVRLSVIGIACALLSIPFSISRLNAFSCAIVFIAAAGGFAKLKKRPLLFVRIVAACMIVGIIFITFDPLEEAIATFEARMETARVEGDEGFIDQGILNRLANDHLFFPMYHLVEAPLAGYGIGYGSNVAARFLQGTVGFSLAEGEWSKVILELGPFGGLAFIILRFAIALKLFYYAWTCMRQNNMLPIMLLSSCFFVIISGQWAPPTILGFSILGGGLVLASCWKRESVDNPAKKTTVLRTS